METGQVIVFVGLLVFLAHFFVILFERTRIPDVLYLTLIGVFIGPVFGIVSPADFGVVGPIFTTIALVVILFEGGLDLTIDSLRRSLQGTLLITLVTYILTLAALTLLLIVLSPLTLLTALFVGAVLAGPAPSIIIPLVRQLRLRDSTKTTLMLESSLGEALCILVALAVLESFKMEEIRVGRFLGGLVSSFVFAVVIGAVGGYGWSLLLQKMREIRHAIFTTPAFVFILYGVAEFLGFSGPVAALTFGITLGNIDLVKIPWLLDKTTITPLRHNETEKLFFGEIVFLVKTFFFVYIGLSVRFADVRSVAIAVALTGILLISRFAAMYVAVNRRTTPQQDRLAMSVVVPKGTAAAVLAGMPLQMAIDGGEFIQNTTYGVVIISIIMTSALIYLLEKTPSVDGRKDPSSAEVVPSDEVT